MVESIARSMCKVFYAGAFLLVVSSCTSTKYATSVSCLTDFTVGQKVLVAEARGISAYKSFGLYENAGDVFKKAGLQSVYAVEEDQSLRLYQVKLNDPDSASLAILKNKLGYDFLLVPAVINTRTGEAYVYNGPDENGMYREQKAREDSESRATVKFMLYSASAGKLIYELAATTKSSPVSVPDKDGGQDLHNFISAEDAMEKAYRKGMKKIMKDCECCSEVNL